MDLGFRVLRSRAGGWSRSWGRISAATAGSTVIISITATTTVTTATTWWHHDGDSQHVHFTRNCKSLVTIATIIMWLRLKLLVLASWCRSAAREGATAEDADSPQQPESNDGGFVSLGRSATKRISLREAKGFSRLQRNLGEELLAKRSARAVLDTVAAVRLDAVTAATALCRLAKCPDAASVAEGGPIFTPRRLRRPVRRARPGELRVGVSGHRVGPWPDAPAFDRPLAAADG